MSIKTKYRREKRIAKKQEEEIERIKNFMLELSSDNEINPNELTIIIVNLEHNDSKYGEIDSLIKSVDSKELMRSVFEEIQNRASVVLGFGINEFENIFEGHFKKKKAKGLDDSNFHVIKNDIVQAIIWERWKYRL